MLAALWLLFLLMGAIFNNDGNIRSRLNATINRSGDISALAELAREEAGSFELRSAADTIALVASSDEQILIELYEQRYSQAPEVTADSVHLTALEEARGGDQFDATYLELTRGLLTSNISDLKALEADINQDIASQLLEQIIANHEAHLATLADLP